MSAPQQKDADERRETASRRAREPRCLHELAHASEPRRAADDDERSIAAERVADGDERVQIARDGARVGKPHRELEGLTGEGTPGGGVPFEHALGGEEVDHASWA